MEYNMNNLAEFTHDYSTRTMDNYNTILQLHKRGQDQLHKENCQDDQEGPLEKMHVFEVTQLINSLFGTLIMPFESIKALNPGNLNANIKREINRKMQEADENAFKELSKVICELKETQKFYNSYVNDHEKGIAEISFVHRLRNSLAHSGNQGLRFYPVGEEQRVNEITSIIFCDEDKNGNNFIAELSVKQVERVLISLTKIFGKYKSFSDYYNLQEYKDNIRMLRDRMGSVYTGIFEFGKEDLQTVEKRFSSNFRKVKIADNRYRGYTEVYDEQEFISWIFLSRGRYKLVGPEKACMELKNLARAIISK